MGLLRSKFLAQETHQIEFLFCILKNVLLELNLDFLNILLSATNERLFSVKYETEKIRANICCLCSSETARQRGGLKKSHHAVSRRRARNYPVTWRHILEERRPLLHLCYGLKLAIVIPFEFNWFQGVSVIVISLTKSRRITKGNNFNTFTAIVDLSGSNFSIARSALSA